MTVERTEVAKKKPGFARDPKNTRVNTAEVRRHRDRAAKEALAEQALMNATSAAFAAAVPDDSLTDLHEYMASQMQEVSRLLATSGPAVITAMLDKAKNGDTNAAALLLRHLTPAPTTRVKVTLPKDATITDAADSVLKSMLDGSMPVEHCQATLAALEKGGNVALSAAVLDRLNALQTRIATISASVPTLDVIAAPRAAAEAI